MFADVKKWSSPRHYLQSSLSSLNNASYQLEGVRATLRSADLRLPASP